MKTNNPFGYDAYMDTQSKRARKHFLEQELCRSFAWVLDPNYAKASSVEPLLNPILRDFEDRTGCKISHDELVDILDRMRFSVYDPTVYDSYDSDEEE